MYQTNVERWFFCLIENKDVLRHLRLIMQSTPESYNTTSQEKQGKKKKKQIKKLRSLSEIINTCDLQTISSWKKLESLKEKHTALIWNQRKKEEKNSTATIPQRINGQEYDGTQINSREKQPLLSFIQPILLHIYIYVFYSYCWWIEKVHTRIVNVNFIMGELGGHQRDLIKAKRNS